MAEAASAEVTASGRRVLITGAFGFVGGWLTDELLRRDPGMEIVGWGLKADSDSGVERASRISGMAVDLTDRDAVFDAMGTVKPSAVIHLAAISAPREAKQDPARAWNVNLFGTVNLAEATLAKAPRARFIHVSSSEVYGESFDQVDGPVDETALLAPLNLYGLTKSAADLAVGRLAREGLKATRFRPFNHTGPGQTEGFVVGALASQIARIEMDALPPVLYVGNTSVRRDILDVRDIVRAYASAVLHEGPIEAEILNLASGNAISIAEIAERLCGMARIKIAVEVDPARIRTNDLARTLGSSARAEAVLGWRPQIAIEQTLADVLDYWRARVRAHPTEAVANGG